MFSNEDSMGRINIENEITRREGLNRNPDEEITPENIRDELEIILDHRCNLEVVEFLEVYNSLTNAIILGDDDQVTYRYSTQEKQEVIKACMLDEASAAKQRQAFESLFTKYQNLINSDIDNNLINSDIDNNLINYDIDNNLFSKYSVLESKLKAIKKPSEKKINDIKKSLGILEDAKAKRLVHSFLIDHSKKPSEDIIHAFNDCGNNSLHKLLLASNIFKKEVFTLNQLPNVLESFPEESQYRQRTEKIFFDAKNPSISELKEMSNQGDIGFIKGYFARKNYMTLNELENELKKIPSTDIDEVTAEPKGKGKGKERE